MTPNQDGTGVINAFGDGVDGFDVGDRVWLSLAASNFERTTGPAQEYTNVPATHVVRLPDATSFDESCWVPGRPDVRCCSYRIRLLVMCGLKQRVNIYKLNQDILLYFLLKARCQ